MALLEGVRCGYFDPTLITKPAAELDKQFAALKLNGSFQQSWDLYHESFDNNQEEVLDSMYASFISSVKQITPLNMNSTIALFKGLGRLDQAAEMIAHYVEKRSDEPALFDPQNYLMFGELTDQEVSKAFKDKHASFKHEFDAPKVLRSIADTNGWSPEEITYLSQLPVADYYQMFKGSKGKELRKLINACLQFDRIGNATSEMKEVSRKAREALGRIAKESPINACRVKPYGMVDAKETKSAPESP
jgi:hypothetical protein